MGSLNVDSTFRAGIPALGETLTASGMSTCFGGQGGESGRGGRPRGWSCQSDWLYRFATIRLSLSRTSGGGTDRIRRALCEVMWRPAVRLSPSMIRVRTASSSIRGRISCADRGADRTAQWIQEAEVLLLQFGVSARCLVKRADNCADGPVFRLCWLIRLRGRMRVRRGSDPG